MRLVPLLIVFLWTICIGADVESCVRLCGELNTIRQAEVDAKKQWDEQRLVLEGELAAANAQLSDALAILSEAEKKTADKRARVEELEKEMAVVKGKLEAMMPHVHTLEKALLRRDFSLPGPLIERLAPMLKRMRKPCEAPEEVPDRLVDVVATYKEISDFTAKVTFSTVLIPDNDGKVQEYDVIYVGLASAYALARDGKMAAWGRPPSDAVVTLADGETAKSGWSWTYDSAWVEPISKALDIVSGRKSAQLVPLPMTVSREEGK